MFVISFFNLSVYSYEYLVFLDKTISTPLTGYITNLSPIKDKVSTNGKLPTYGGKDGRNSVLFTREAEVIESY